MNGNIILYQNNNSLIKDSTFVEHTPILDVSSTKELNYIKLYDNSIPYILCDEIIELFEKSNLKHEGITFNGLNKNIKDTIDLDIPNNEIWLNINNFLNDELSRRLQNYIKNVEQTAFDKDMFIYQPYLIQKYKKNSGKYIEHSDEYICKEINSYRCVTFIWYLNDVNKGGETVFWGDYKITPKKGRLIFFPALWCFPHKGNIPLSSDKYIITGWINIKY